VADSAGDDMHVLDNLGLYLLGALPTAECRAVERHLAACPSCLAEADNLADPVDALIRLPDSARREIAARPGMPAPGT
jgi:anti-sigma factor RsiW